MTVMRQQLTAVGLGDLWVDGDLTAIAEELGRRRAFAGDGTAGGRALLVAAGITDWWRGAFGSAAQMLEQARSEAELRGDVTSTMVAGAVLGLLASLRGQDELAEFEFTRVLDRAGDGVAPVLEVNVRSIRVAMSDSADHDERAGELDRCRAIADRIDRPDLTPTIDLAEGWVLSSGGRFDEAAAMLRRAVEGLSAPLERSLAMLRRAEVLALDGRHDEARCDASAAVDTFRSRDARYWAVRGSLLLASIDGDRGGRRMRAVLDGVPDDPAYARLLRPAGSMVIELDAEPALRRDGRPVALLTRHAQAALLLLAAAGGDGVAIDELTDTLWPGADPARVAQRLRTLLWQVRTGLGPESWRLQRHRGSVILDTSGIDVNGHLDRTSLAMMFRSRRVQTSSGSYSPRS